MERSGNDPADLTNCRQVPNTSAVVTAGLPDVVDGNEKELHVCVSVEPHGHDGFEPPLETSAVSAKSCVKNCPKVVKMCVQMASSCLFSVMKLALMVLGFGRSAPVTDFDLGRSIPLA